MKSDWISLKHSSGPNANEVQISSVWALLVANNKLAKKIISLIVNNEISFLNFFRNKDM